jgi:hypothetical protein
VVCKVQADEDSLHPLGAVVNGKRCFQKTLVPVLRHGRIQAEHVSRGCEGSLKVRKGNTKGAWWGAGGVCGQRERAFLLQMFLKLTLIYGKGGTIWGEHGWFLARYWWSGPSLGNLHEFQTFPASTLPHNYLGVARRDRALC